MESPLGLNDRLQEIVFAVQNGQELFDVLKTRSPEVMIELFENAADDQTWVEERGGAEFMALIIPYLTESNINNTISKKLLQMAAKAIQKNFYFLFRYMPEDIAFHVENYKFMANSLLFRFVGGDYFSSLIDDYVVTREQRDIELKATKIRVFQYLKEFIYTGEMKDLWKEDPKIILSVQKKGNKWRIKSLSDTAFRTFKNYISREVLFQRLVAAFQAKNHHMTEELLVELEKENLGFKLELVESGFKLTLKKLNEEIEKLLDPFTPFLYTIRLTDGDIEEEFLKKLFRKCVKLEKLDLSALKECKDPGDLIISLPQGLLVLSLHDLKWVTDSILESVISHFPHLNSLNLAGCEYFKTTFLSELSLLNNLETINLSRVPELNHSILSIVTRVWKTIINLDISSCKGIDDKALKTLLANLEDLKELNLRNCRALSLEGILQLANKKTLRRIDIRDNPSIPPNFKEKYGLRFYNVEIVL